MTGVKMKKAILCALVGLTGLPLLGQDPGFQPPVTTSRASAAAPQGAATASAGLLNSMEVLDNTRAIRPGDVISLRVVEDRREAIQTTVSVTGEIQAPYMGLVRAAGKTSRQLAETIKTELERSYFKVATVIVVIDRTREEQRGGSGGNSVDMEFFTGFGQVIRQGKYELPQDEDVTISQAILRAGGFAQFGNPKKVRVVRKVQGGNKTILVNCDDIMRKGNLDKDIYIRDGDVVIVDEKKVNF
jgi:protein involved in polysaccharide export with SLBB domain